MPRKGKKFAVPVLTEENVSSRTRSKTGQPMEKKAQSLNEEQSDVAIEDMSKEEGTTDQTKSMKEGEQNAAI